MSVFHPLVFAMPFRYNPRMTTDDQGAHRRRPRYRGTHPRAFHEKYKELHPERYAEDVEKVKARGDTPAGSHRPIMVAEILDVLRPCPGEMFVDGTLGYGGHAQAILPAVRPGGRVYGLDVDPLELPKTEARLRAEGFSEAEFQARRTSFAALPRLLAEEGIPGIDGFLADLGVSSMQLDNPARGFTFKREGPLDLRMNPNKGAPASALLVAIADAELADLLRDHADEPRAEALAHALAGRDLPTTTALAAAVREALPRAARELERDDTVRRVFQALRIAVNGEFDALDSLLSVLPGCLNPGARVAVLTFHSGEDRRVKQAFQAGLQRGVYAEIAPAPLRPTPEERHDNPRASSAKLRWAVKGE
jgi:16S rRNA (cytosine1402-N4)-methyltransferase